MQVKSLGLSENEHRQAAGLLNRVYVGLRGVLNLIRGRYPAQHPIRREIGDSIAGVQAARIELDNAAHAEHPATRVNYLTDSSGVNPDALANAVAESGDDITEND